MADIYGRFKPIPFPGERRDSVARPSYQLPEESNQVNYSTGEVKTYGIGEDKPPTSAQPIPPAAMAAKNTALGNGLRQGITADQILNYLLPRIKGRESSGNPNIRTNISQSDASGLYQYTSPTWNNYKGYKEARLAPPDIQEERMRADTLTRLNKYNNDVFRTVAEHYYPAFADKPHLWDTELKDANGKPFQQRRETVREYLHNVLPKQYVDAYLRQRGL